VILVAASNLSELGIAHYGGLNPQSPLNLVSSYASTQAPVAQRRFRVGEHVTSVLVDKSQYIITMLVKTFLRLFLCYILNLIINPIISSGYFSIVLFMFLDSTSFVI